MKRIIFYLILFIFVVAISPYLIGDPGYILISLGQWTIESSVVAAGIFLFFLFGALLLALKALRGGYKVTTGTWRKITFAGKRKAEKQYQQGVAAYLIGDYSQAEQLLIKSAENKVMSASAYTLAASAAKKQAAAANSEYYLDCLAQLPEHNKHSLEQVLAVLHQHIELKNYQKARALLDEYHKHIGHDSRLLAYELDVSLIEERFEHVIEYLPKVIKDKAIKQPQVDNWCQQAFQGVFTSLVKSGGEKALNEYWHKLAKKLKQQQEVIFAYCTALAQFGFSESLADLLIPTLKFDVNKAYLQRVQSLPIKQAQLLISHVQKHLHKDPHNAKWLSFLGFLAVAQQDYDLACKAYTSLGKIDNGQWLEKHDMRLFAQALMAKNDHQHANQLLLKCAE